MAELFKNAFNPEMIQNMGDHITRAWPEFNTENFVAMAVAKLEELELKERSKHITKTLAVFLPNSFEHAAAIIQDSLAPADCSPDLRHERGITGWATMPLTHYVSTHGMGNFDLSMRLLKDMTVLFTAEFDIRFFLIEEEARTLSLLETWARDPDHHVRRLVSEGTRPRLPWAMKLQSFIDDPAPVIALLEILKDDDEEYVRRSVANNLNDIAKDHPDLVADIAKKWLKGADKNRIRLIKHGCRTLIKQGHHRTLEVLGYNAPDVTLEDFNIETPRVKFEEPLIFNLTLNSTSNTPQNMIIDYAIHHLKANGRTAPKVFKWKTLALKPMAQIAAQKKHTIKKITTRTYYNGMHQVEILVNGRSLGKKAFELYGV